MEGLKFVVTGVLESLARQEAEQLIKQYGGHTTSAVSSKTTHLLAGEDAGPSKLSKVSFAPTIVSVQFANDVHVRHSLFEMTKFYFISMG